MWEHIIHVSGLESHSSFLILLIMQCPLPSSCLLNSDLFSSSPTIFPPTCLCLSLTSCYSLQAYTLPQPFLLLSHSDLAWEHSCPATVHPHSWLASGLPLFLTQVPFFSVSFPLFTFLVTSLYQEIQYSLYFLQISSVCWLTFLLPFSLSISEGGICF